MPKIKDQITYGTRWNRQNAEAARLGLSVDKLRQLTKLANIHVLTIGGSCVLYDPDETDAALLKYSEAHGAEHIRISREKGRLGKRARSAS